MIKMRTSLNLILLILLTSFICYSQTTGIKGIVFDGEFNEPMPFANVFIKGTEIGSVTDFDGNYTLEVVEGTYTLVVSFVGYETKEISGVTVGSNIVDLDVLLNPSSNALEEVIVVTTAKRNTETAILNIQRNAVNMKDGLSVQSIKRAGDGDLAAAIKRVPGISVQEGGFVFVRGLGDRYSKTLIDGLDVPGLDPNKNTLELDIFPTSILKSLFVEKSADSRIAADFTGGIINVQLKEFSSEPEFGINFSVGYNPKMHFNPNFIKSSRRTSSLLSEDDGSRDLPIDRFMNIPRPTSSSKRKDEAAQLISTTRSFYNNITQRRAKSFTDYSFGVNYSNSFKIAQDTKLGLLSLINYESNTDFLDRYGENQTINNADQEYQKLLSFSGNQGRIENSLTGLFGVSVRNNYNVFSIKYLQINNSDSTVQDYYLDDFRNQVTGREFGDYFTEKKLKYLPLKFIFIDPNNNDEFKIRGAYSESRVLDKDFNTTTFEDFFTAEGLVPAVRASSFGSPERLWRSLFEYGLSFLVDYEKNFRLINNDQKAYFGFKKAEKRRTFFSNLYEVRYGFFQDGTQYNGNPSSLLSEENLWKGESVFYGSYISGGYREGLDYNSSSNLLALYFSTDLSFNDWWKLSAGIRYEHYDTFFTGVDIYGKKFDKVKFINEYEYYPQLNNVININDNLNLRLAYFKTTARPSFKESSTISIVDPIERFRFYGNPELKSSIINNYDIRLEKYWERNQMLSVSYFIKEFRDPIEIGFFVESTPREIIARNGNNASVKGFEVEFRKDLIFNDKRTFSLSFNYSKIKSSLSLTDQEYEGRKRFASPDGSVEISRTRSLAGQSPYIINGGLFYKNLENDLEIGVGYNVQGLTLFSVGQLNVPDIYEQPFHDLNMNLKKELDQNSSIKINIRNILNSKRELIYKTMLNNSTSINSSFSPGMEISLGYSFKF